MSIPSSPTEYRAISIKNGRPVIRGWWSGIGSVVSNTLAGAKLYPPLADVNKDNHRLAGEGLNPLVEIVTVPRDTPITPIAYTTAAFTIPDPNNAGGNFGISVNSNASIVLHSMVFIEGAGQFFVQNLISSTGVTLQNQGLYGNSVGKVVASGATVKNAW